MDTLLDIAKKHNLIIIEDAQGLGAKYKGKGIGTFDKGTIGLSCKKFGVVWRCWRLCKNDEEMYNKVKLLRDHGRDENGKFVSWGFNSRLDNYRQRFKFQIKYYNDEINRRRDIATL